MNNEPKMCYVESGLLSFYDVCSESPASSGDSDLTYIGLGYKVFLSDIATGRDITDGRSMFHFYSYSKEMIEAMKSWKEGNESEARDGQR